MQCCYLPSGSPSSERQSTATTAPRKAPKAGQDRPSSTLFQMLLQQYTEPSDIFQLVMHLIASLIKIYLN